MLFYQIASYVAVWKKKKIDIKKRTCMMPGKRINTNMIAYSLLMRKKKINWYTNSLRVRKSEKFVCSFVPNDLAELRRIFT